MNIKKHFLRRLLTGVLCSAVIITQAVPVFATDEYGAPLVTATPTPDPHTPYYKQPADTDSIKDWAKGPQIEGESAILVDMFTGAVLYSKNADKAQYPASITKIMTALLGCENLDPSQKFTMSQSAAYGISDSNSSSIYADTGEEFTIEQALMAVMLQSANEMTLAVAELTTGSTKKFVEQMNLKARQLGCTNTHFNNPNGLPVELEVEKKLGLDGKEQIEEYGMEPFIQQCKESVWKYKGMWEDFSSTVGFWADMENPYVTYHDDYIESEWWALKEIWNKKLLYKGFKIVPYCPRCGTPLSAQEVSQGYKTVKERSAIVRFKVVGEDAYFLAWTTTPWTLPSNVALCVNPTEVYCKVKAADGYTYYMAEALLDKVLGKLGSDLLSPSKFLLISICAVLL
jgi:hypothetical protein